MTSPQETAALIMEDIPFLMRLLRAKFREKRVGDLSMVQFRTLAFVDATHGASLSETAGHIGVSLPSMSKLVDTLVDHKLLARETHGTDRRRICLSLTPQGKRELDEAYQHTQSFFAGKFAELTDEQRTQIAGAMDVLKNMFAPNPKASLPELSEEETILV